MVHEKDFLRIQERFNEYVSGFYTGDETHDGAIRVKEVHSKSCVATIVDLACSMDLGSEACAMAKITALLHDFGRFEQYAKYKTYRDGKSEDHGSLGVRMLDAAGIIDELSSQDRDIIKAVVAHHNKATIPVQGDERFLLFLKLVRDADKLDIYRIVIERYRGHNPSAAIGVGLPDAPGVSETIVDSLLHGQLVEFEEMKTLNDLKCMQIGWIFDINFHRSFRIIKENRYLEIIGKELPKTGSVRRALEHAFEYLERKCALLKCKEGHQFPNK